MASTYARRDTPTESGVMAKVVALMLGILVAVLAFFALLMWADAREARDGAVATTDHGDHNVALPLSSFAGQVGDNATDLAEAHAAYDATLPPIPAGDVVKIHMTLKDMVVEIAPGVHYNTWAFDGHGVPGPIVHVREGQTVEMTLTNGGAIPHSIDFHAARIAPDIAFRDAAPGESSRSGSRRATPESSCTTAARSPCSHTSPTACTERSSSSRRKGCRPSTTSTSSSAASGT